MHPRRIPPDEWTAMRKHPWFSILVLVCLAPAFEPGPSAGAVPLAPNLCKIAGAAVSSAGVTAPCTKAKVRTIKGKNTPLGRTATVIVYQAHWGTPGSAAHPQHSALATVMHATGSSAGIALFKHIARADVLSEGAPVALSGGIASVFTDASACLNPPTGQCGNGHFLALKGTWQVSVGLGDYPPMIPGAAELPLPQQEAAASQLEERMKPELIGIGKAVAAKV
jgi:hypothetical protein